MLNNFRKILDGINVAPILQQIEDHPEFWNIVDLRTGKPGTVHYDVSDIIMRYPRPKAHQYNFPAFTVLSYARDVVFAIMTAVQGEYLGRVLISKLPPGATIPPHIDHIPGGIPLFFSRYQVPLLGEPGVEFHAGDEQLYMEPGYAYWFNNQITHSVMNNSASDRISMVIDLRPYTPA